MVVTNAVWRLGAVNIPNDFLESTDDLAEWLHREVDGAGRAPPAVS